MSNVVLSQGIRQNLLSLQETSTSQQKTQLRLATGKKVNSAIDNPVNFFTAGSLSDRGEQLMALLDGMSNGVQTIQAASKGIDGITRLVKSLQSTLKQAQTEAVANHPTKTAGAAFSTSAESVATGYSLKDVALNKLIGGAAAAAATSSVPGNLGAGTGAVLAISISDGTTTFSSSNLSQTSTVRDLVNEINKSGIATAIIDDTGKMVVTGTGSGTLQIGIGDGATAAAAVADAQSGTNNNAAIGLLVADWGTGFAATGGNSAVRTNLVTQFNDLRTQIDQLAQDAGYNGTNLLGGNKLSIVFNEKTGTSQNKLDVQGQVITSLTLGILSVQSGSGAGWDIQNDTALSQASDALTAALTSLRTMASTLGSNLAVVQTRQDFTKSMIETLQTGSDRLILADQNEEGANLLALNTRQQLSQTALSLSAQAEQGVLRLFG